jgi:ferric-dicitrate binding protein FerR (iron transport regulator)
MSGSRPADSGRIAELLDAYFDETLDALGGAELQAWLRADPAHRVRFLRESALRCELRQALRVAGEVPAEELAADDVPPAAEVRRPAWWQRARTWAAAALILLSGWLGFLLLAPPALPPRVVVSAVAGDATLVAVESKVVVGATITPGATLATGAAGAVTVTHADGTSVELAADTRIQRGSAPETAWTLHQGTIAAEVAHQAAGQRWILRTPHAAVIVVGTAFTCQVAADSTELQLHNGVVRIQAGGTELTCHAGESARADAAGVRLVTLPNAPVAFAGATGFGARSQGGRGGRVIPVTTLADDGPGSLRAAVAAEGPRIVVFHCAGTIALRSPLQIRHGRLTIAGQTAPGGGICLRDAPVEIGSFDPRTRVAVPADDVVIRHLRLRPGDRAAGAPAVRQRNGLTITAGSRISIDHCSLSWTTGKAIRSGVSGAPESQVRELTIQDCLIAEPLSLPDRAPESADEPNSFGVLLGGTDLSVQRNVFAHVPSYVPKPCGDGRFDFRNNLIFNWRFQTAGLINVGASGLRVEYVGTWLIAGPDTPQTAIAFRSELAGVALAVADVVIQRRSGTQVRDPLAQVVPAAGQQISTPIASALMETTWPASAVMPRLLPTVGASRPRRDAVDARICGEISRGAGRTVVDLSDDHAWPDLAGDPAPSDRDGDGLPDAWEIAQGLDPQQPADAQRVDVRGLTPLDAYLDELAGP